jgi:tRNA(Ile)-lysidine synthase
MKVTLPKPGKYVVAVSGGVDSVVLLHVLQGMPGIEPVVAHFDHGIRDDSAEDRKFVQSLAKQYGLPFVYDDGRLGPNASEAAAREARYQFLEKVQKDNEALAIITAHHQDDLLETAIINLLRGTGRKGLTSLANRPGIERPLLGTPKQALINYAKDQGLRWREDSTNQDQVYLRNYVRQNILPRFDAESKARLLSIIEDQKYKNEELDELLGKQLDAQAAGESLDRQWFVGLSHAEAKETMAAWLRSNGIRSFDNKTLERLVTAAKVAVPDTTFDVLQDRRMVVGIDNLALSSKER